MLISCFYLKERRGGPGSAASTARAVLTRWGSARAKPRPRTATPIGFWGQKAVFWQTQGVGDNEAGGSQGCRAGGPHEHPSQPRHQRHAGGSQRVPHRGILATLLLQPSPRRWGQSRVIITQLQR